MNQVIQQTDEEKMAMYMKLEKEELIHMLIQANKHLDNMTHVYVPYTAPYNPFQYPIVTYGPPGLGAGKITHGYATS